MLKVNCLTTSWFHIFTPSFWVTHQIHAEVSQSVLCMRLLSLIIDCSHHNAPSNRGQLPCLKDWAEKWSGIGARQGLHTAASTHFSNVSRRRCSTNRSLISCFCWILRTASFRLLNDCSNCARRSWNAADSGEEASPFGHRDSWKRKSAGDREREAGSCEREEEIEKENAFTALDSLIIYVANFRRDTSSSRKSKKDFSRRKFATIII